MTQPRRRLVSIEDTPYYHCIGRCVRRAFLCGTDEFSGQNYEHRRKWVTNRLKYLSQTFAIDVCSYAVMSNHYHVVVKLNPAASNSWSDKEIVEKWARLFSGNEHTRAYLSDNCLTDSNKDFLSINVPLWRKRLSSLSWFMRCLNEYIARRANFEDNCTGHFWEGRFKSQALLDEAALVSCMAYVDLNPIRAKVAKTPEESDYTSIQERIQRLLKPENQSTWLLPMTGQTNKGTGIPLDLENYLALIDWTGRCKLQDKPGSISNNLAPILTRLDLNPESWLQSQENFGKQYCLAFGSSNRIKALATKVGKSWLAGQCKNSQYGFV